MVYGDIRNVAGGQNNRLIVGNLRWTVTPAGGAPVTVDVQLRNINDQFSYTARVPFETVLAGFVLSSNTLALPQTSTTYSWSATVDGAPATIVPPALSQFTFAANQRGRLDRVDLQVSLLPTDRDGDGIPDAWELAFGLNPDDPADAQSDADRDGLKAFAEYRAGTDPRDAGSVFEFINVQPSSATGILVEWSSVEGKAYSLERSTDLLSGFTAIQTNIPATAPKNTYHDATATASPHYFYRLRVE
jgi:hypothetical protein